MISVALYKDCVYPFVYKNVTYNFCAPYFGDVEKFICATNTDDNQQLIGDQWGFCDTECKQPKPGWRLPVKIIYFIGIVWY